MDLVSILRGLRCYRLRATDLEHNKLLKTNILSCLHQNVPKDTYQIIIFNDN
jgi:hypothetical protein